jgi:hypothetical protein
VTKDFVAFAIKEEALYILISGDGYTDFDVK